MKLQYYTINMLLNYLKFISYALLDGMLMWQKSTLIEREREREISRGRTRKR